MIRIVAPRTISPLAVALGVLTSACGLNPLVDFESNVNPLIDSGVSRDAEPRVDIARDVARDAPAPVDAGIDRVSIDTGTVDAPADAPRDDTAVDARMDSGPDEFLCPPDPGLLVCLRFENNLDDSTTHLWHAFRTGSAELEFGPGRDGQGLVVSEGMRIELPNESVFHEPGFTLEAWVNLDSLPGEGNRAAIADKEGQGSLFVIPSGIFRGTSSGTEVLSAPGAAMSGRWYHVAVTGAVDRPTILYVDGISVRALRGPGAAPARDPWHIGHNDDGDEDPFTGTLDHLRIWSRVRTPAEIRSAAVGR